MLESEANKIGLASATSLPENFSYADPTMAKHLNIDLSPLPFDAYLPSATSTLSERTCPVGMINFPSVAQMVEHRRARHKYTRQKLPEDYESTLFEKSHDIDTVVDESNDGFIYLLRNGYVESRVLNKTDEHVIAYNSRKNAKVILPSITICDWARLVPPKDSAPDTFGQ